jgi:chromosomal replication initiator protein
VVDQIAAIPLPGRNVVSHTSRMTSADEAAVNLPAFIAGPENRLVAAMFDRLLVRAESPATAPAPTQKRLPLAVLSLFGPSGVGKTHLSQGLVHHWQRCRGQASAEYVTAQDFRRQFNEAMSGNAAPRFRERFRTRELIAIDELHRLPSDDYLLQELRATLDALDDKGSLVVVTSTRPVTTLSNLSPDLLSRLAAGLMLQLAAPGIAARTRIVQQVSSALGRTLSDAAVQQLAAGLHGTASRLVGAIFELFSELRNGNSANADHATRLLASRDSCQPTPREIVALVARHYGVPQKLLKSNSRKQYIVRARATAVYLARELSGASYDQIGRLLGGRDHTTIMHNFRKVDRERQHDFTLQETLDELSRILLSR